MSFVDFHTHILPGIDDGSRSAEMSRSMLEEEKKQGVGTVILTPHFYVNDRTPERFLARRREAFRSIAPIGKELGLRLVCGAEVYYFEGIRNFSALEQLTINGSDILLLEMPFADWSSRLVADVKGIAETRNVRIVLAHIDRYLNYCTPEQLTDLRSAGIRFQMNAEYLLGTFTGKRALRMIEEGMIAHIGSDCHNMTDRRPNIAAAARVIAKRTDPGTVLR